ncbi:hypothetical protein QO002_003498 [Pararhizobium capsulatum DSM 1112]|uniref:Uncharacterized protein n=2 Tax=Pararhizobium capsulatum TaxID=34014 RepID=A0ABU0BSY1_9HYPH|nr:hypothetical protein [Pararhizobium capsulatum DSM 1112]
MTMIGLHKLADQIGDGMVPELYELLSQHSTHELAAANITPFPVDLVRLPRRSPHAISTLAHALGGKILLFPSSAAKRDGLRRKQG